MESASTRFRLLQLLPLLQAQGVVVTVRPFMDAATYRALYDRASAGRTTYRLLRAAAARAGDVVRARGVDVVLVLREAMLAGPPVVELLAATVGRCPVVLDLDDPTWISYDSPTYGRLGRVLKWPGKTLALIDHAAEVTCGNQVIAAFVAARGRAAIVVPAVVDTAVFRPRSGNERSVASIGGAGGPSAATVCGDEPTAAPDGADLGSHRPTAATVEADGGGNPLPVVGWVGTHSSFRYLETILPVLASVAREHPFRLRVVGAGRGQVVRLDGVEVDNRAWDLAREPDDFASLDVGLYPLVDDEWARGKSALKSVQYLACGVPYVASPVGAAAGVGVAGTTHLLARSEEEWREALSHLLGNPDVRAEMGRQGRSYALAHHQLSVGADLLASVLRRVAA